MMRRTERVPAQTGEDKLARCLELVEQWLKPVVERVAKTYRTEGSHPYRGLYLSPDEAMSSFKRTEAAAPAIDFNDAASELPCWPRFQSDYGLESIDAAVILLALAPELDTRFQRLYGFAQDDVTKRWLGVDLASAVLCAGPEQRLYLRRRLGPEAPLIRHKLIYLSPEGNGGLLAARIGLDEQVIPIILGEDVLDARIAGFTARLALEHTNSNGTGHSDVRQKITLAIRLASDRDSPVCIVLAGPDAGEKRRTMIAVASALSRAILDVDASEAPAGEDAVDAARVLLRHAFYWRNLICVSIGSGASAPFLKSLLEQSGKMPAALLLSIEEGDIESRIVPPGALFFTFANPDATRRRMLWRGALAAHGLAVPEPAEQMLATRFRLSSDGIARAVATASAKSLLECNDNSNALIQDLSSAARAQTGQALDVLARKVECIAKWPDIVLPPDSLAQLSEMCARVALRDRVLNDWGFGRKLNRGRGVHALFAGPSGTGKTMAAEVVANELGLDLYKIDLSTVVSKYIGETEKNLERIFSTAEETDCILFFDEADALMGKRSAVHDAHDRYANLEISYLLQRMEEYAGVSVLATNLRCNLDDAFVRRLSYTVHFPFPDEAYRLRIWQGIWPKQTPLDSAIDFTKAAAAFKLTGGNIRNIALAAAYLAAEANEQVAWKHILNGLRREYQKMGRQLSDDELDGFLAEPIAAGAAA